MKRVLKISRALLVTIFLLLLLCTSAFAEDQNIAVLDFHDSSQLSNRCLGSAAADIMAEELVNWGKCNVC